MGHYAIPAKMAGVGGIEPPTNGLTVRDSTSELHAKDGIAATASCPIPDSPEATILSTYSVSYVTLNFYGTAQ